MRALRRTRRGALEGKRLWENGGEMLDEQVCERFFADSVGEGKRWLSSKTNSRPVNSAAGPVKRRATACYIFYKPISRALFFKC